MQNEIEQRAADHEQSNSARSTTSWESQFRVQAPNSVARAILIVALDAESGKLGALLVDQDWHNATFVKFMVVDGGSVAAESWRTAFDGRNFDLVVMIGTIGQDLAEATAIGETCMLRAVKISGVLMEPENTDPQQVSDCLRLVRPWTHTLAVVGEGQYLPGLLHALGA